MGLSDSSVASTFVYLLLAMQCGWSSYSISNNLQAKCNHFFTVLIYDLHTCIIHSLVVAMMAWENTPRPTLVSAATSNSYISSTCRPVMEREREDENVMRGGGKELPWGLYRTAYWVISPLVDSHDTACTQNNRICIWISTMLEILQ